jgi:hypothetical protein
VGVIVRTNDGCETAVKGNNDGRWSSDGIVLWLGRRQDKDTVEWLREWSRLIWSFYSSGGCESIGPGRVAYGCGANSILQFQLRRGGNETKSCWKMKWRQRARLASMERRHQGGEREETTLVGLT